MSKFPGISMLCPTYNLGLERLWLLEEVVECYRRCAKEYDGESELVILNDAGQQTLLCDTPGVRVFNLPHRFSALGAKFNYLVDCARYQILMPAEHDDISLPHRLRQAAEKLTAPVRLIDIGTLPMYFNPQRTWFIDPRGLHSTHNHGYCHNASAFTRRAWELAKGYPAEPFALESCGAQDKMMDARLKGIGIPPAPPLPDDPSTWSYIYRFGVANHLSGKAPHQEYYRDLGEAPIVPGTWTLTPHWQQDYVGLCRAACARHPVTRV